MTEYTTEDEKLFHELITSGRPQWVTSGPTETYRWDEEKQKYELVRTDPTVKSIWMLDGQEIHNDF